MTQKAREYVGCFWATLMAALGDSTMRSIVCRVAVGILLLSAGIGRADVVTDWNETLNAAIIATPLKHNPGNPTRAMAMMNGAIYDIFQAVDRTHAPFKVNRHAPGADINAAVARAAYLVISDTYGEQQAMLDGVLDSRLGSSWEITSVSTMSTRTRTTATICRTLTRRPSRPGTGAQIR
jgi:hypothetical protein